VLRDGRFVVFGGTIASNAIITSCAVLTLDADGERWDVLPSMHEARCEFACAAIGGCVIVAGGWGSITAEVYEERLGSGGGFLAAFPSIWCGQRGDVIAGVHAKGSTRSHMLASVHQRVQVQNERRMSFSFERSKRCSRSPAHLQRAQAWSRVRWQLLPTMRPSTSRVVIVQ